MHLLFSYVVYYFIHMLKKECIVTSIKSDRNFDDKGVHQYGRGVDLRTHHLSEDEKIKVVENINDRFNYGRGHRCALIHGSGDNEHLHIQVPHDNNDKFLRF